jgi:hypothetical protein
VSVLNSIGESSDRFCFRLIGGPRRPGVDEVAGVPRSLQRAHGFEVGPKRVILAQPVLDVAAEVEIEIKS